MSSVIEKIAEWSSSSPEFSAAARRRAGHAIADTLACMVAGAEEVPVDMARKAFVRQIGRDGAANVGGGRRAEPAVAALINATAAHALDYDDNFLPSMSHASAVLVPAMLAVGQASGCDGRTLVDAYLIALEAQAAVGRGVKTHPTTPPDGTRHLLSAASARRPVPPGCCAWMPPEWLVR